MKGFFRQLTSTLEEEPGPVALQLRSEASVAVVDSCVRLVLLLHDAQRVHPRPCVWMVIQVRFIDTTVRIGFILTPFI